MANSDATVFVYLFSPVLGIIDSEILRSTTSGRGGMVFTLDLGDPVLWGTARTLMIDLQARNCLGCRNPFGDRYGQDVSGSADFANTLVLQSVTVTRFTGQPAPGVTITGEGGTIYVGDANAAVPEPASFLLAGIPLAILGGWRIRR